MKNHFCIESPVRIVAYDLNDEYPSDKLDKIIIQIHTKDGEIEVGCLDILMDTEQFMAMYEEMGPIYAKNKAAVLERQASPMPSEQVRSDSTNSDGQALVLHPMHHADQEGTEHTRGTT